MSNELPDALQAALAETEAVLIGADKLAAVMDMTARAIPSALSEEKRLSAELGRAEIADGDVARLRSELAAAQDGRAAAARGRLAASDALLAMSDELRRARQEIEAARSEYANGVLADFNSRWNMACRHLAVLTAEARELGAALRSTVPTPSPYQSVLDVRTDRFEARLVAASVEAPEMSPQLAAVAALLDRMDSASALVAAIGQARELTARHVALSRVRPGLPMTMVGTFVVLRPFAYCGSEFQPGMLIDRSLVGDGALHRFVTGRTIRLAEDATSAAA